MNEKLKNLNKKQFEKCLITLEMLTFETPKIYTAREILIEFLADRIAAAVVVSERTLNLENSTLKARQGRNLEFDLVD